MAARPQNVGIKAIEIYFPGQCVDQTELEKFDGVAAGKYTIGLGQNKMSFCDDREDIYSIALTTLSSLFAKYSIDPNSIGRLEVGTETMLDKSKSVKSVLMQLFEKSGNFNVEGVDTVNACYGGTNAVFNSVNWVESSAWDGRDAVVIAGDIALYAKGAARPTGGAGCVAMLIGPDAPLAFEPGLRGSYVTHAYDFYKPDFTSEYPVVDGHFSLRCYTEAVDACYKAYNAREKQIKRKSHELTNGHTNGYTNGHTNGYTNGHTNGHTNGYTNGVTNGHNSANDLLDKPALDRFDYMAFHAPTCKLVSKSYARMLYNDYLVDPSLPIFADVAPELRDIDYQASLTDKNVEKTFMALTKKRFAERVNPAIQVATLCGNMYCGSVYGGLVSLLSFVSSEALAGKRIGVFSYGSGLASSLFSMRVVGDVSELATRLNLEKRLNARQVVSPTEYEEACAKRHNAHMKKDFRPVGDISKLRPGTYYLDHVDEMFRRQYKIAQG